MNLYPLAKALTYIYIRFMYKITYEGLENIPADQGFILSSNHQTFYDPLFIAHKVKPQMHFMAKAEFFDKKIVGWLFRSLGAFPVQRGKSDKSAMDTARKIIESGDVMAIFPEGTRSKDGNPMRPKPGVAMVAGMVGCGVQPVGISYMGRLRFRKKVTVRYAPFLSARSLAIDAKSTATIRRASYMVMDAIVGAMDPDCYDTYSKAADKEKGDKTTHADHDS
ncbi:MAG: 1-acyl-sn-glycerol-3-phosphate acyltransferase [Oscillospiraceae bacterium]|jgi:1-acyl-sn-glycerol-3-phosphate acyltransferase|nr:1-acyl-sn-glycerol-3-phosphate acyltransferase [Oscillospiraceae bacterium]